MCVYIYIYIYIHIYIYAHSYDWSSKIGYSPPAAPRDREMVAPSGVHGARRGRDLDARCIIREGHGDTTESIRGACSKVVQKRSSNTLHGPVLRVVGCGADAV